MNLPKKPRAFTLIEMIGIMFIIVILMGISFSALRSTQTHSRVVEATDAMMSFLQNARSKGMNSIEIDGKTPIGYYVWFHPDNDPVTLELYADLDPLNDVLLDSMTFFGDVKITVNTIAKTYGVEYLVPDGEVWFLNDFYEDNGEPTLTITIQTKKAEFPQEIFLNRFSGSPEFIN